MRLLRQAESEGIVFRPAHAEVEVNNTSMLAKSADANASRFRSGDERKHSASFNANPPSIAGIEMGDDNVGEQYRDACSRPIGTESD